MNYDEPMISVHLGGTKIELPIEAIEYVEARLDEGATDAEAARELIELDYRPYDARRCAIVARRRWEDKSS